MKSDRNANCLFGISMSHEPYRRTLGYLLLTYLTLIIAVITLIPFTFAVPKTIYFTLRGNIVDVLTNIVLFIPLGFFFQITRNHIEWKSFAGALCFGFLVSGTVEVGQLFLPLRYSSVIDIITNSMGAGLGAAIAGYHQLLVRQGRVPELFGFGLPLISSVYLLVPLLWLGGISMGNEISRLGLMALVGVFGAGLIASAIVNRSRPDKRWPKLSVFGYATVWFMIGAAPALTHFPFAVLIVGFIIGAVAQLSCRIWIRQNSAERRFELPTLKRLLPVYLFYLLLLSVWPTTVPLGQWSHHGNFQLLNQAERILFVSRFVEVIAAFTLLGYLLTEVSGRKNETGLRSLTRSFFCTMGVAILVTTLRNGLSEPPFIVAEAVMFAIAAMYGAIIYRIQLALVKNQANSMAVERRGT